MQPFIKHWNSLICLCVCFTDHQRLIELGAELKQHCEAQTSPFVPKVGVPCCAKFPGETIYLTTHCGTHCQAAHEKEIDHQNCICSYLFWGNLVVLDVLLSPQVMARGIVL